METMSPVCQRNQTEKKEYTIEAVEPRGKGGYLFCKRLFDVVASLVLLILGFVPMVIIGALVWASSKGPALYCQERLGKNGKPFEMYKFRSMRIDAEKNGPQWAEENDDRCTKVGAFLRKCRLDELPQLWNILIGDMSFVGPRPERAYFYEEFETYIHGFRHRLAVRPGLTGLAQVVGGYDFQPEEKIVLDMQYIANRSARLDLWCIFKTVKLVFTHKGAR